MLGSRRGMEASRGSGYGMGRDSDSAQGRCLDGAAGRFLVLVGIDGSGKTSLLSALGRSGVATASWRDLRDHDIPRVMAPDSPTQIKSHLSPMPRTMFVGGHLVAQYEYLVRPVVESGTDVLLDSYWYKVVAKERIVGKLHPSLNELCRALPVPDAVLFLDVDPTTAYRRKLGRVAQYEYFDHPTEDGFTRFQERLRDEILAELAAVPQVRRIDASDDFAAVLERVGTVVDEYRRTAEWQEA